MATKHDDKQPQTDTRNAPQTPGQGNKDDRTPQRGGQADDKAAPGQGARQGDDKDMVPGAGQGTGQGNRPGNNPVDKR